MNAILAYINKQNVENVPLHELFGNNAESVDVNFVRNFGNNGYGNKYNSYNRQPYVPNKYTTSSNVSSDLENTIRSFYQLKMSKTRSLYLSLKNKILCLRG
jgi:hypothetical protein